MGSQKYSRGGAIALGVFGVALIVMLAALLVACGSGTHSSPDVASVKANTPAPVTDATQPADRSTEAVGPGTGGDGGGDPPEGLGDYVWWEDPETGQAGWIVEGYASIGLEYFPEWVFDPPADAEVYDAMFLSEPTIQALLQMGYELLQPYGVIMAGEFKLPEGMTFAQARAGLMPGYPDIAYVDPWGAIEPTTYPNDPWMLKVSGPSPGVYQWYLENWDYPYDVSAPEGWFYQLGNGDVVIAQIDSGVDRSTPDLEPYRLTEWGWNMWGDYPPSYPYTDNVTLGGGTPHPDVFNSAHGTYTCSLMAASTNNFFQMAGGAWGGDVLPINIQRENPNPAGELSPEWLTLSLYWLMNDAGLVNVITQGAYPGYNVKVINMSLGSTINNSIRTIIIWCLSFETVVVASSGNWGCQPWGNPMVFPAASEPLAYDCWWADQLKAVRGDTVLSVTAFDSVGERWIGQQALQYAASYYNPEDPNHTYNWVDVSAPGAAMLGLVPPPNHYAVASGTSASAPLASALALLMTCEYPEMSSWEIHDAIEAFTRSDPPLQSPEIPARIDYELALSLGGQ
ncbi:S8 family serine peptidase [bacterium]|nr:S8 family serine peptidase [bacterium]